MKRVHKMEWFLIGFSSCLIFLILIPFKFNWEFKATDALQVTITLLIAVLIQHYAVEQYSDRRTAKNLLMQRAEAVSGILIEAHKLFISYYIDGKIPVGGAGTVITIKQNFSNAVYKLEQGIEKCGIESRVMKDVVELRSKYCEILTGGNFPANPYSLATYVSEGSIYRSLDDSLEILIFEINDR